MQADFVIYGILAMAENRVIGNNNRLPWHLPADLKRFKNLTVGHPIIMGRKTFESIGKPLPNRTNIILSQDQNFKAPGCMVVSSLDAAIDQAKKHHHTLFIIGGAHIFEQSLPLISRLYITIVHASFAGDALFPELSKNDWKEVEHVSYSADQENPYAYSFLTWERK